MAKNWYIIHAYSNYEKRVVTSLKDRIEINGMEDLFGEILVPSEEVVEIRDGKKRRSERKFYDKNNLLFRHVASCIGLWQQK